ncbi:MAG: hypothetical protein RL115_888 [Bacteroidota bacterium]|jgi:hypothetical protein
MQSNVSVFLKLIQHPIKFRLFLFSKLPAAYFAGVRVRQADMEKCIVSVPYKWLSQNPFRSTYFACLSMAAEMSTGVLAMAFLYKRQPAVSMLVVKVDSTYHKKATGLTSFLCTDGKKFEQAIENAINTGEAQTVIANTVGTNKEGEVVAEFVVTWSFKAKK